MNIDHSHIFRQMAESLRHYYGIQAVPEVAHGADYLSLYNLAMGDGVDIGETVCRYALFHAFLELDDYEVARRHLDAFAGRCNACTWTALAGTA